MKASVIICTYTHERLSLTVQAVNSVNLQTFKEYEIIIVASHDDKLLEGLKAVQGQNIKVIVCKEKGLSAARNCGVKHAVGDIMVFLDDDAIADSNWLQNIMDPYKDEDVLAVGGNIIPKWEGSKPKWFPEELNWVIGCIYKGHPTQACLVRNLIGCNMSFRKLIFDEIGGFSTKVGRVGKKLLAGEEVDFCLRIMSRYSQGRIVYKPKAVVHHVVSPERKTIGYVFRRSYNEGISKARIKKIEAEYNVDQHALGTEMGYLAAVRSRDLRRTRTFSQGLVLYLAILFVGAGYAIGKFR